MSNSVRTLLLVATALITFSLCASAANISRSSKELCAFDISGPIEIGDFNRIAALVATHKIDSLEERTSSVCLKSNGGSYPEGLKIAELIYLRGLSTVVEHGSDCFSSCAIIFMAGVMPDRETPMRKLSVGAILGFHAPFLSAPDQRFSKADIEMAVQGMRNAILSLVRLAAKQTKLKGNEFIKKSLISKILDKGPDEAFFVKTIYEAARWDILVFDVSRLTNKPNNIERLKNVCRNLHSSNMDEEEPFRTDLSLKVENYSSEFQKDDARILVQNSKTTDTICEIYPRTSRHNNAIDFFVCTHDYWSSKSFGNCRDYRTAPAILIGKFVPDFFSYAPSQTLLRFSSIR